VITMHTPRASAGAAGASPPLPARLAPRGPAQRPREVMSTRVVIGNQGEPVPLRSLVPIPLSIRTAVPLLLRRPARARGLDHDNKLARELVHEPASVLVLRAEPSSHITSVPCTDTARLTGGGCNRE
jgi:hypothetical protein